MQRAPRTNIWWGEFDLADDGRLDWVVGPLAFYVERRVGELIVHHCQGDEPLDESCTVAQPGFGPVADGFSAIRFPFQRRAPTTLRLVPALADRPVVVLPRIPVAIASGESLKLHMSTPVWVRLEVPEPTRELMEIPTFRPSDTWFGANTMVGQLGYASSTKARVSVADLKVRPSRAITAVTINNLSSRTFVLERLSLPAPRLDLYVAESGQLWTQSVWAEWRGTSHDSRVRIERGGPEELPAQRASRARTPTDRGVFTKAFNLLIG